MNITAAMREAALEGLADDPLAQKLLQAFWSAPSIGEYSSGGKMIYTVGEQRFSTAGAAYSHCIEALGRKLSQAAVQI